MNVAGAPVITFRRIGTRNSAQATLRYFRRRGVYLIGSDRLFFLVGFERGTEEPMEEEGFSLSGSR